MVAFLLEMTNRKSGRLDRSKGDVRIGRWSEIGEEVWRGKKGFGTRCSLHEIRPEDGLEGGRRREI